MLDPLKPTLILPEVVDTSKWWKDKHHFVDREYQYVMKYTNSPQYGAISYNTKLVNLKEINSFNDLLDPKWKGKILVRDIRIPGPGGDASRFFYYNPKIGPKYLKRLFSEMDITLFRDLRQSIDWLTTGRFSICFFCHSGYVTQAKVQGLPVDKLTRPLKEGVGLVVQAGTIGLMNGAPHPNAARVFINGWLSREGQLNLQREAARARGGDAPDSLRIDISQKDVPLANQRKKGVAYLDMDTRQDWLDRRPIRRLVTSALSEKKKK